MLVISHLALKPTVSVGENPPFLARLFFAWLTAAVAYRTSSLPSHLTRPRHLPKGLFPQAPMSFNLSDLPWGCFCCRVEVASVVTQLFREVCKKVLCSICDDADFEKTSTARPSCVERLKPQMLLSSPKRSPGSGFPVNLDILFDIVQLGMQACCDLRPNLLLPTMG